MATTVQQIDAWRAAHSEHQRLEFKEAKTQFDNRKLYKYCVALANEGGGYLLLDIEDQPPRKVVGTAAFNDPVEMAAEVFSVSYKNKRPRQSPEPVADRESPVHDVYFIGYDTVKQSAASPIYANFSESIVEDAALIWFGGFCYADKIAQFEGMAV